MIIGDQLDMQICTGGEDTYGSQNGSSPRSKVHGFTSGVFLVDNVLLSLESFEAFFGYIVSTNHGR